MICSNSSFLWIAFNLFVSSAFEKSILDSMFAVFSIVLGSYLIPVSLIRFNLSILCNFLRLANNTRLNSLRLCGFLRSF